MAGHSKFKNIQHRKNAQDKKRAKLFTRLVREITTAAKFGPDPNGNARLRCAIEAARNANVPKANIEAAVNKGSESNYNDSFEEVRYEGYGPHAVAFIVETLTDNRNRTASEVRAAFTKYGGNLGETGSVSFMFNKYGCIFFKHEMDEKLVEEIMDFIIENNAQNFIYDVETHECEILTEQNDMHKIAESFIKAFPKFTISEINYTWKPNIFSPELSDEEMSKIQKLYEALEDLQDVQNLFINVE